MALGLAACENAGPGGAARAPQPCQLAQVTTLAFSAGKPGYLTNIELNGQTARMILDTGAARSLVAGAARARFKLGSPAFNSETLAGLHGYAGASIAYAREVRLGQAHGRGLAMLVLPDWRPPPGVDGLLGIDYLGSFDMDIDVPSGRLGLYKPLAGCHTPATAMTGALYGVDLLSHAAGQNDDSMLVPVVMHGHSFAALLDTGNFHTSIYQDAARRAGLAALQPVGSLAVSGIEADQLAANIVVAPQLQIGDLAIRNIPLVVLHADHAGHPSILLGRDFFDRVHVWVSRSSHSIIMQYPPAPTPEIGPDIGPHIGPDIGGAAGH